MAAPPSPRPRPPESHSGGGDALVSLFLDTDLGTRLGLFLAPDTTMGRLKPLVAEEHAAAFPELGPIAVKSFQVRLKGAWYHLSESMTVAGALTKVKGRYFLHVKMADAAASMHCRQGVPQIDGRRTTEGHTGIHVEKHVRELPAATPENDNDIGVPDDIQSSSQLNAETKKNETALANDADIDEALKQTNVSRIVDADAKDLLHGNQNLDVDGVVADNKQIRIEEDMLGQINAMDDLYQGHEHKNAKRTGSIHLSATDPGVPNESDSRHITKSSRAPLETNPTHGELLSTSLGQEVTENIPEDSLQIENASTVGKKKKRKRRQLTPSKTVCSQETTKLPSGAVELSKSGDEAEFTMRDGMKARSSVLLLSSKSNDEGQGGKHIQFVNNAQAYTGLTSEQGNFDHVHNGDIYPSIVGTIDSTAEVPAIGEKITEGSNGPWDEEEKHEEAKQHEYSEENHDGGVAGMSNMEKDGKNTDASEKRPTIDYVSQENKRRKAKKVNSVDMASMDTAEDKEMLGHPENAGKSDKVYTEREIVHGPSVGPASDNVQHGDSNVTENQKGDGRRKRKRRRQSEFSKGADPNQDQAKSPEHATDGSSMQHKHPAPLDAQQTQGNLEGARVSDHTNSAPPDAQQTQGNIDGARISDRSKFGESLDMAATNMIDDVLADLKSQDSLNNYLSGDVPTGLELPESTMDKVGNDAALPPKYPETIGSNAPVRSPSHKKPKGKQLKVLSTMIDSSHQSNDVPEEDANTELKESDALRFSGKTSDLKDVVTGDVVAQADDKAKGTKRQRKKVKKVPTDNGRTTQSENEQVNPVAKEELKEADAVIHADLDQGGSVLDTPVHTVAKVQQKGKRAPKTRAPKIQETNHSTHTAKDSQDENAIDIIRSHDNENAVHVTGTHDNENAARYPTEPPLIQKDATTLKSAGPNVTNARKERKKSLKTELQSRDFATEHDPSADMVSCGAENGLVSPASNEINFLDHFSSGKKNDQLVCAENKQNDDDENIRDLKTKKKKKKQHTGSTEPNNLLESLPAEKTSLTGHFGANEVVVPSAEVRQGEYDNVKGGKEKKKRKRKPNSEGPAAEKESLDGYHQGSIQDSLHSVVQKGRMEQNDVNENNNKVTQNVSIMQTEPEDRTCDRTVQKKLDRDAVDNLNNLPISKDDANISKELQKSTSHKKTHGKSSKPDENVGNIVKSFSMSPQASSDSAECTPQIANRYRVAVRKVPKKRYEQTNATSKKESRKVGSGAIFSDAISEEYDDAMDTKSEKVALEASLDNSSPSADSGVSSAAFDESELHDDDGALSLSQKNLRGLHFGSILRGSSSYKKAKQKQDELLDDDTEVPDSQPADGLWG